MSNYLPVDPHFATRAIHEGNEPEQWNSMAVVPPISMATTFKQDGPAEHRVGGGGRGSLYSWGNSYSTALLANRVCLTFRSLGDVNLSGTFL